MTLANDEWIQVDFREKELVPGKKTKQWVEKQVQLTYDQIKETKITISFK
jgi:hypothetical protein